MIRFVNISLHDVQLIAFDRDTHNGKAILLQDLLRRMKQLKNEDKLSDDNFIFLQNTSTGEIRMEIV